jgi:fucose 4-O-acetylase-like acetyltransferase
MSAHENALLAADLSRVAHRVKGLLILVVAIDHNDWFRQLAPQVFGPLTFHVIGFFLLAFSFTKNPLSLQFMVDRAARYLLPFWWALALSALAYGFVYKSGLSGQTLLENFLLAASIGSASLVKTSSGLFMLWFLPCLFGLTCLVAAHDAWQGRGARAVVWGLAIGAHMALPYLAGLGGAWVPWVPFGLLVGAYVFVLGLVWRQLLLLHWPCTVGPVALCVFVIAYGLLVANGVPIEIGTFEISALRNPFISLLHGVSVYSAMLSLIWAVGYFKAEGWMANIGKNSLLVYLIHPVFYLLLSKLWVSPAQVQTSSALLFIHACATTAMAVGLAYGASWAVTRSSTLSAWISPQTWQTWAPVAYFGRLKKADTTQ